MLDIPYGSLNNYETKNIQVTENVLTKITNHPTFKKYTLWLMTDSIAEEYGQISPSLTDSKKNHVITESSTLEIENVLVNSTRNDIDTHTIINIINNMNCEDRSQLAKILSKEGFSLLLELLDPKNQALLGLTGFKKLAAWQLEAMSDERAREILSEIEADMESNPKIVEKRKVGY